MAAGPRPAPSRPAAPARADGAPRAVRFPFEPDATEIVARLARPRGEWVLRRRLAPGGEERYEIILNGRLLMDTADDPSAAALASVALELCTRSGIRALVGGLGFGFTLGPLLAEPRVAAVDVVELEPALPDLLSGLGARGLSAAPDLSDPRLRIEIGDVRDRLRRARARYDCVLLDVDNGPESLSAVGNEELYGAEGLALARRALRPSGALCIWSSEPSPRCLARMRRVFGNAGERLFPVARDGRELVVRILCSRRPLRRRPRRAARPPQAPRGAGGRSRSSAGGGARARPARRRRRAPPRGAGG